MNERIKKLAEQAGFYITIDGSGILIPDPSTEDITEVSEKFAELIVKECADIADVAEPFQSSDLILKHFGVEE